MHQKKNLLDLSSEEFDSDKPSDEEEQIDQKKLAKMQIDNAAITDEAMKVLITLDKQIRRKPE